jgi:uncharacterized membrane protein
MLLSQTNENSTTRMQKFASLTWYDKFIEFIFRFTAKTSEPLLAAGIVYSAADVLSHGLIGMSSLFLNNAWAITQSVAIESSGGVVLVYGLESIREKDKIKAWLYLTLSLLLSLAGGIMLFMQLAGWTEQKDSVFMLMLFALRCIVSIGYIYLCRTKHIRFTPISSQSVQEQPTKDVSAKPLFTLDDVRLVVIEVMTQMKEDNAQCIKEATVLQIPERTKKHNEGTLIEEKSKSLPENYIRVQAFLMENPNAKVREVASALSMSFPTASKWMRKVRDNG